MSGDVVEVPQEEVPSLVAPKVVKVKLPSAIGVGFRQLSLAGGAKIGHPPVGPPPSKALTKPGTSLLSVVPLVLKSPHVQSTGGGGGNPRTHDTMGWMSVASTQPSWLRSPRVH